MCGIVCTVCTNLRFRPGVMRQPRIAMIPWIACALVAVTGADESAPAVVLPHISVRGTNWECGYSMGKQMKSRIEAAMADEKEKLQWIATPAGQAHYKRALAAHNRTYPHLVREMQGLAAGSGLPFSSIFVKNIDWALIYLMDPWDREKWQPPPRSRTGQHCTDYIVSDSKAGVFHAWGHNEDGDAKQKSQNFLVSYTVWREEEDESKARQFTSYTYAGMLSGWAFGANEHVAFSINALLPKPPEDQYLSIYVVCRDVLESTSIEDAVRRATVAGQAGGASYNIGEYSTGEVANFETAPAQSARSPARVQLVKAADQPRGVAAHANAYMRLKVPDAMEKHDAWARVDSADRVRRAMALPPASDPAMILRVEGDTEGVFPIYNHGTLATSLFDLGARSWHIWTENAKGEAGRPDTVLSLPPISPNGTNGTNGTNGAVAEVRA